MSHGNPILGREELPRWPFRRRPIAQPGTTLVFQTSNGTLINPSFPVTSGDVSLRGLRVMFVVDLRPRGGAFQCKLPSRDAALEFDVAVNYTWLVREPITVVEQQVSDAQAECQAHLTRILRRVSRRIPAASPDAAEVAMTDELSGPVPMAGRGLEITAAAVEVRSDSNVIDIELEKFNQSGQLALHDQRVRYFADVLKHGGVAMAANILAQDPAKAAEAAQFMVGLSEKDQRVALDAMKIIIDGDQVRIGELDDAVRAVVERFQSIVSRTDGTRAAELLAGETALIGEAAAPPGGEGGS
jgi:hypothetical protein